MTTLGLSVINFANDNSCKLFATTYFSWFKISFRFFVDDSGMTRKDTLRYFKVGEEYSQFSLNK